MTPAKRALAFLGVLLLAGCLHGGDDEPPAPRAEQPRSGPVTVSDEPGTLDVPFVAGDRLYGLGAPDAVKLAAWAGDRVLAYRIGPSWPDLLVLDGPRRRRVLARAGALVAVSPDGRRAFVSTYGASPPVVRVLDLESGEELARRTVTRLRWLTESGSWSGDVVAATASAGVAVFRVRARSIVLEQVLGFTASGVSLGPFEPRLDATRRRIVAWAELEPRPRQAIAQAVLVECDRVALRCFRGAVASATAPPRPVYNPSRP